MTVLNLLAAIFIMTAAYSIGKPRLQLAVAIAAALGAPAAFGVIGGLEGLVFSLAGGALALVLTMPLSLFGHISRTDVLVSIALGGALGAVQYGMVFAVATALLMVQRLLKIESASAEACAAGQGRRAGLLALDEQSALVEIEAMKILHTDRKEFEELARREGLPANEAGAAGAAAVFFPWTAKLALATLAVLMIGTSF
jgi:CBS-domain-containing membrane protein